MTKNSTPRATKLSIVCTILFTRIEAAALKHELHSGDYLSGLAAALWAWRQDTRTHLHFFLKYILALLAL